MRFNKNHSTATGLSLVEVLVVVSILAILASLTFGGLLTTKRTTVRATCINNIRQILIANQIYSSEDNSGRFTPFDNSAMHPFFNHNWLWRYGDLDAGIFFCPNTKQRFKPGGIEKNPFDGKLYVNDLKGPAANAMATTGYSYDVHPFFRPMENFWNGNDDYRKNTDSEIKSASTLNSFTHKHNAANLQGKGVSPSSVWLYSDGDSRDRSRIFMPDEENNHGNAGGNVGMCDGSAQWVARIDYVKRHEVSQDNNRTREYPR